ncbi:hypothetical protein [Phyllobacterium sp. YR531]|uniref:hypothetical protein n=1 Tax=Phyllobacterium sp. YR531 TaxID=1144343 RepID=UPI00026FB244|nr:hypothetical protein [Phyllobacterium sp. YR531]EJN04222.1 hypothetical protein PMI41_01861 [Phyllobacterium sp. YR531]
MKITFSPIVMDATLTLSKSGDILTINGEQFDFTDLPDGGTIPSGIIPCDFICGEVSRINGKINLTLALPHGLNPSQHVAYPRCIRDAADGDIAVPHDPVIEEPPMPTREEWEAMYPKVQVGEQTDVED